MKYFVVCCVVLIAFSASAQVPGVPADSSAQVPGVPADSSAQVPGVSVDSSAQVQGVPADSSAQESGVSVDFGVHGNIISSEINAVLRDIAGLPAPSGTYEIALEEVYGLGLGGGLHLDVDIGLLTFRLSGDYVTLSPDEEKFAERCSGVLPWCHSDIRRGGTNRYDIGKPERQAGDPPDSCRETVYHGWRWAYVPEDNEGEIAFQRGPDSRF